MASVTLSDRVIDNGLQVLDTECTTVYGCSAAPTTYLQASATYKLATKAVAAGTLFDSPGAGSGGGRAVASVSIIDGTIDAPGNVSHLAFCDDTNSRLLAVVPLSASVAVVAGQMFRLDPVTVHMFSSPPTYIANGVTFSATAFGRRSSAMLNVSDGKSGLLSFWLKNPNANNNSPTMRGVVGIGSDSFYVNWYINNASNSGKMGVYAFDQGGTVRLSYWSTTMFASMSAYKHCLMSWNTATGRAQMYVGGVNDNPSVGVCDGTNALDYTGNQYAFIGNRRVGGGELYYLGANTYIADLQLWLGSTASPVDIDLSNPANVAAFISSGYPVDPANAATLVGRTPNILMVGDASTWLNNAGGTAGSYTLTGSGATITNVAGPP